MATSLGEARGRVIIEAETARAQAQISAFSAATERDLGRLGKATSGLQSAFQGLASSFGLSLSVAGALQLGRMALEADELATAYERQSVAALSLAGSQAQLNELLDVYAQATGGAIGRAQALADVTRLMAVGFADSAQELDEFTRAARGISLATGQQQDYVISQLQLAIANQSELRLDQLGLGVDQVKQRIDQLKAANTGLTDAMAYQNAILGLANEKFGDLADSVAGQATEAERLRKAWNDLRLEMGQAIKPNVEEASSALLDLLNLINRVRDANAGLSSAAISSRAAQEGRIDPFGPAFSRTSIGAHIRNPILGSGAGIADAAAAINQPLLDAQRDYAREVQGIHRESASAINDAERSYGQQRAEAVRSYGVSVAREEEDFQRARIRQAEDLANAIADIHADAARREAQQVADLARTIADAREDSAKRLADLEEDYARTVAQVRADSAERIADMEENLARTTAERRRNSAERVQEWEEDLDDRTSEARANSLKRIQELEEDYLRNRENAALEHSERLSSAAGRLDAIAIAAEQRRYALESKQRQQAHGEAVSDEQQRLQDALEQLNEAHAERLADEQEALDKSIAQANEAHARALTDEREALDKQIAQANAAYARQVADEKEALEERIANAQEAHALQLENARLADEQRIADMVEANEERQRREDEDRRIANERRAADFQAQLNQMAAAHGERMTEIGRQEAERLTALQDAFEDELYELGLHTFAMGEKRREEQKEELRLLQEFWDEARRISQEAIDALPTSHPSEADPYIDRPTPAFVMPSASVVAPGATSSITTGNITVTVAGTTGMSEVQLERAVERGIIKALEQVAA